MSPVAEHSRVTIADDVGRVGAERFLTIARDAIAANDSFRVALAGGKTPQDLYSRLGERDLPWDAVDLFFGDERCVPQTDERSNYRMVREALLDRVPAARAHYLHHAADYEALLRSRLGASGRFDLVLLGMGEDGHTASLFPGSPALAEEQRWVVAAPGVSPDVERLTITPPLLRAAAHVLILVAGERKAERLRDVLEGHEARYPVQIVDQCDGSVEWIVDRAAAGLLERK